MFLDDPGERGSAALAPSQELVGLEVNGDRLDSHALIMHGFMTGIKRDILT